MDKKELFELLKKQKTNVLIKLLQSAFDELNTNQRWKVFGDYIRKSKPSVVNGKKLLAEVKKFYKDSFDGMYYAPFDINSKNYSHIPEETEEWFDKLGELLEKSTLLTKQEEHKIAAECFSLLYDLIERMGKGDEIVFADEIGNWMIPGDEKTYIKSYATSLSAIATPEEYAKAMLPIIRDDSIYSFTNKAYSLITNAASKEQKVHLEAEIKRKNIRTNPSR
jgi:hypothetical protein